ncbi:hypothetical protein PanWU01x14_242290 [Parasponia andersonii]|uniref:Uncharacterized protein n=1 Tax=Parasponia andersonii TaxID=3476 RepID=A0A2P5BG60_PARAD|nr:hypothetical protein PanWU01x14_242290 [Parasponia andersonii]
MGVKFEASWVMQVGNLGLYRETYEKEGLEIESGGGPGDSKETNNKCIKSKGAAPIVVNWGNIFYF